MKIKRFLAVLLCLLLTVGFLPASALAADTVVIEEPAEEIVIETPDELAAIEEETPAEPEAVTPVGPPQTLNAGYYLIGRNGWTTDGLDESTDKFERNYGASTEEYKLRTTLEVGQQIKVVEVWNIDQIKTWFPEGNDNNYTVDNAHKGDKMIYFRPNYNADWAEFGGYMYITDPPTYHVYITPPANGTMIADRYEACEGDPVNITPIPNAGYYPNTIKSNDYPPNFTNPDAYHASFNMPARDVTVYMLWNQFVVDQGYYYSIGINSMDLTPAEKFSAVSSMYGEYAYEATLVEGDTFDLTRVLTQQGWSSDGLHRESGLDWTITPAMAGHVKIFLSSSQYEGYIKAFDYSQWTAGSEDMWLIIKHYQPITVAATEHGTVTAPADAFEDDNVILTVTPDAGYMLDTLTVTDENGDELWVTNVNGTTFNFYMPDSPVTVTATFKQAVMYNVTLVGAGEGVTLTASPDTAKEGDFVYVNIGTDSGHKFVSITVTDDGGNVIPTSRITSSRYRFTMPASDVTVTVVTKEIYPLKLAGEQVDSLNRENILGDGTASYDPATRTLSFSSADPAFGYAYSLIYWNGADSLTISAPNGLNLTSSGSYCINTDNDSGEVIINGDVNLTSAFGNGIWVNTLTINGNVSATAHAIALYALTSITVDGNVTVNSDIKGIETGSGAITVVSGTWDVTAPSGPLKAAGGIVIPATHSIALPEGGVLGALTEGATTYTMVYEPDGTTLATHVIIRAPQTPALYTVTVSEDIEHGTVEADKTEAAEGDTVTLTVTPDAGYRLASLTRITGDEDHFTDITDKDENGNYYFIMPAGNVTVYATFEAAPVTVTFDAGEGTVEPATVEVTAGAAIGELPVPTRTGGWVFMGWYLEAAASQFEICQGTEVTAESTFDEDTTFYAHWRLPGDVNGDGKVNATDVTLLATFVKARGSGVTIVPYSGDVNNDGKINATDVTLLATFVKARGNGVVIY